MATVNGCDNCTDADPKTIRGLIARRQKLGVRVEDIAKIMGLSPTQVWRLEDRTRRMKVRQAKEYEAAVLKLAGVPVP